MRNILVINRFSLFVLIIQPCKYYIQLNRKKMWTKIIRHPWSNLHLSQLSSGIDPSLPLFRRVTIDKVICLSFYSIFFWFSNSMYHVLCILFNLNVRLCCLCQKTLNNRYGVPSLSPTLVPKGHPMFSDVVNFYIT